LGWGGGGGYGRTGGRPSDGPYKRLCGTGEGTGTYPVLGGNGSLRSAWVRRQASPLTEAGRIPLWPMGRGDLVPDNSGAGRQAGRQGRGPRAARGAREGGARGRDSLTTNAHLCLRPRQSLKGQQTINPQANTAA